MIESNKQYIADRLGHTTYQDCLTFPKFFEIETVRACNARCSFCAIDNWNDLNPADVLMSDSLLEKLFYEIRPQAERIDTICLCRDGEPLLDKRLSERVRTLKNLGVRNVVFSTNGQLLSSHRAEEFLDAGLTEIMFSIDGYTKETFESIRKNLDFDVVIGNVLNLIQLRDKHNSALRIRIRLIITDENRHEVDDWHNFWRERVGESDLVQARPLHNWGNQLDTESASNIDKYATVPCIAPYNMFVLHSDGKAVMCGHDFKSNHVIGDFTRQSISEIWQGEEITRIRELHLNSQRNQIEMCRGCEIWDRSNLTE